MIHNLYPITNLTTLFAPWTIFLYDLFAHKEIYLCGHIFHLLKKSIVKQKAELQDYHASWDFKPQVDNLNFD